MNSSNKRPTSSDDTRQRLLVAAIEQIELHGLAKLTVRNVAAAAGANIAAVNYHFRSKDALIEAALELSMANALEHIDEILARIAAAPEDVLSELFEHLLEGTLKYPQLGRANLYGGFINDDYSGPFPRMFAPVLVRLRDELRAAVPGLDARRAARRVTAAISGVFFPPFFRGLFAEMEALASARERRSYARELARAALAVPA